MIHTFLRTGLCLLIATAFLPAPVNADALDFTLHKLSAAQPGNIVLIVGGIQGDEPGGFNAAALLTTHYKIKRGAVWVVPNLNFLSIVNRTRGIYGDLNRKFADLPDTDPEFSTIARIKSIITDKRVSAVLNLHDGSGFFRHTYVDRLRNPRRWGQCVIIDRRCIETERYSDLAGIAGTVTADVNRTLIDADHRLHVHNTRTHLGNAEMAKTLTYFATCQGKPAFGLEVSKSFPTHLRAYYHLRMIESFLTQMGVAFERRFDLTPAGIKVAIRSNNALAFYDSKILLDVQNARKHLGFFPLQKNATMRFTASNPLIAVVKTKDSYRIFHGNRRLTRLYPQYFEYDSSLSHLQMKIDDIDREVQLGGVVGVDRNFLVKPTNGYRINIIGFTRKGKRDETGIPVELKNIQKRYSVDKKGRVFRVEVYKKEKFSGMIMVNFNIPSGFQRRCLSCDTQPEPVPSAALETLRMQPSASLTSDAS
jgi:hypothetical protein